MKKESIGKREYGEREYGERVWNWKECIDGETREYREKQCEEREY